MKAWTFKWGYGPKLNPGIALQTDEKLGQVVYLGESGRGRRYEKIALDRRYPAIVTDGRVFDAEPVKVTLPARDGKPEKVFFVLANPKPGIADDRVLVRINTETSYVRGANGTWRTVAGEPETIVSGYGAYGDAGRIGNWKDGLVTMRPGDVLRVKPSRGDSWALWIDAAGNPQAAAWQDFENLQALKAAEQQLTDALGSGLDIRYGKMPCFTWSGGQLTPGLQMNTGATGPVVKLGEAGRGRTLTEVPVIDLKQVTQESEDDAMLSLLDSSHKGPEVVLEAAVAVLDEKKGIFGLTHADVIESGAFLVRVSTQWVYTRGTNGYVKAWKGTYTKVTAGQGAHGDAGYLCNWQDELIVLHEGDVLYIHPEGGYKSATYALFVKNGQLQTELWRTWKLADARRDPDFYVAKGTAPWGHVPQEWIGRVVTVVRPRTDYNDETTGELITISPLVLNLGWDGRDYAPEEIREGTWIRLEADKQVTRLVGEQLDRRQQLRCTADEIKAKAENLTQQRHFRLAESRLREQIEEIAREWQLDTRPTEGYEGLEWWINRSTETLQQFAAMEEELLDLLRRQDAGEILVDFAGHFRRMGVSGQCDLWVIQPDGTRRSPDSVEYRKRYTSEGNKYWRLVASDELALQWYGALTGEVAKLPVNDCTPEQLATIGEIENELELQPNAFGLNANAQAEQDQHLAQIVEACKRTRVFKTIPPFTFHGVTSQDGYTTDDREGHVKGTIAQYVNHRQDMDVPIDNRMGQEVARVAVAGGVLQLVVYPKYGQWNVAIRWFKPTEELVEDKPADEDQPPTALAVAMMEALRKKQGE